jgi:hypothetical protein
MARWVSFSSPSITGDRFAAVHDVNAVGFNNAHRCSLVIVFIAPLLVSSSKFTLDALLRNDRAHDVRTDPGSECQFAVNNASGIPRQLLAVLR